MKKVALIHYKTAVYEISIFVSGSHHFPKIGEGLKWLINKGIASINAG